MKWIWRPIREYRKDMKLKFEKKSNYRCPCCRRLLFKAKKVSCVEIKCPKCGKLINIDGVIKGRKFKIDAFVRSQENNF